MSTLNCVGIVVVGKWPADGFCNRAEVTQGYYKVAKQQTLWKSELLEIQRLVVFGRH
jgi:hypothetical protein